MYGFFGKLFDFDGDGKLSPMERAADFGLFVQIMEEEKRREEEQTREEPPEDDWF